MLTKNHLRFSTSKQKITPKFLQLESLPLVKEVLSIVRSSYGQMAKDIDCKFDSHSESGAIVFSGLKKLVEDRCVYSENKESTSIKQNRLGFILQAQEIRTRELCSFAAFSETFERETLLDYEQVSSNLYQDLPAYRVLQECLEASPESLLQRYNCAQLQGLLIKAVAIKLELEGSSQEKCSLLKHLKFHRLLYDYEEQSGKTVLNISGPCDVLQQKVSYGIRLANFFPHILNFSKWSLQAQIKIHKGVFLLQVNDTVKIKSHYKKNLTYLPEEFIEFVSRFNDSQKDWQVSLGEEMLDLGKQKFIFPDMVFTNSENKKIYFEIFHRWHQRNLSETLEVLSKQNKTTILVGACRSIGKKCIEQLSAYENKYLLFRDFPTVMGACTALKNLSKSNSKK
jgi:uncharacterized protein